MPEHAAKSEKFVSRAKSFARASGIFVILIGLVALSGWIFDVPKLKSIYGDITMKANAALALILTGFSLWDLNGKNNSQRHWFGQICGSSAAVIGLLTLSEHAFGWNLRIDQLLFTESPGSPATTSPGRMGITASFCFTAYGISLLLLYHRFAIRFAQIVSIIAGSWALLAVIGYTYQAEALFGIARYTGIAFPTAIALFVLCLGILATCVEEGMLSIVCDETAAGIMVRRLGLVALTVPVLMGWLRLAGQRAGHFDLGFGTALLVSAIILTFLIAIWRAAVKLQKVEQQRLATEAIAIERQERLRRQAALIDLTYEPIFLWDLDSGIMEWNKGCEQLYGFTESEAIAHQSHQLLKTKFPTSFEECRKTLEQEGRWSGELRHITREGREVVVESRWQLVESGAQRLVMETNRDVTSRRSAERERERLLAQEHDLRVEAEKANRVKDEFLATVSHELRTPLNAMLGWSTMLHNGKLDENMTARAIDVIERNAKAQAQLVEDLLDVSRIISGNLRLDSKPIALTFVIKAAMESVQLAADAKEIKMQIVVDPTVDNIKGDATRLQQIIWNLLSNSIKFTPKYGRVVVTLDRVDSMAQVAVTDSGEGISTEFLPYVFERFKQADASITKKQPGLGLGLAIARHLVEMHGGTITAESAGEGQGATFKIRLPLEAVSATSVVEIDPTLAIRAESASIDLPDLNGIRILVVDNDTDALEMLRVLLAQLGADVTTASSARGALDLLPAWKPDVLVSDIGMPEEDGFTLIKKVRALSSEQGGTTPAIALTGYVRVEERMRALAEGFQMFVRNRLK